MAEKNILNLEKLKMKQKKFDEIWEDLLGDMPKEIMKLKMGNLLFLTAETYIEISKKPFNENLDFMAGIYLQTFISSISDCYHWMIVIFDMDKSKVNRSQLHAVRESILISNKFKNNKRILERYPDFKELFYNKIKDAIRLNFRPSHYPNLNINIIGELLDEK